MRLHRNDYRNKVLGCWLGKNVGGTLGAPFEWKRQVNNVTFYVQKDLNGQPMPNDDLDIQLLWLCALEERGIALDAHTLAEYWCLYVTPHWSEYGIAKTNMRQGLPPPLSGTCFNAFRHSCGSYIRAEIWACIAPGMPHVAARYAYEDAILDHGNGEGLYAEIFTAALESAAFVLPDLRACIDVGLSFIPDASGVTAAVRTALECREAGRTWLEARDEILRRHRGSSFFGRADHTSPADHAKGFHEGVPGYDVPSNIGLTLIALLYGGDDFGAVQCTAVNCGEDTDCTAATAGSIWGLLHGADKIPARWIEPIGRGIKTVCLNLGDLGFFGDQLPATVDALAARTERIARQVLLRHGAASLCGDEPTDLAGATPERLHARDHGQSVWGTKDETKHAFDFFTVRVGYGDEGPFIRPGQPKTVRVSIDNPYKVQANLALHWYLPEGWRVTPGADAFLMSLPQHLAFTRPPATIEFQLACDRVTQPLSRAVIEITAAGRPTVMLVPVMLLNGIPEGAPDRVASPPPAGG